MTGPMLWDAQHDTEQPGRDVPVIAREVYAHATEAWPAGRGALHAATLARELGRREGAVALAVRQLRGLGLLVDDGHEPDGTDRYIRVPVPTWRRLRADPLPW